jgi:hypothetical protein
MDRQQRLDQRLTNQLEEQRINPLCWATTSPAADTSPGSGQMDLDGNTVESSPDPTPGRSFESLRGQQLGLSVTVPRAYHSKAWGGTVSEAPLDWPLHWTERED